MVRLGRLENQGQKGCGMISPELIRPTSKIGFCAIVRPNFLAQLKAAVCLGHYRELSA